MNTLQSKSVSRDAGIDHLKLLMIFLMVLGHTFEQFRSKSPVIAVLFSMIYIFHMEGFVFLAGYFSKNTEKCRNTAFQNFLVPYFIFNLLSLLWLKLLSGKDFSLSAYEIFTPQSTMWFLMALFIWKILLRDFVRIRWILPISILLGLGTGVFASLGIHDSFSRIFTFLPFFLLGYYTTPKHIERIRQCPRWVGWGSLVFICGICVYLFGILELPPGLLYHSRPYRYYDIGLSGIAVSFGGIGLRLLFYLLAGWMIAALILLMPHKPCRISKLGENTLTVYLLHFFIIRIFKVTVPWTGNVWLCLLICLMVSSLLTLLLSLPAVSRAYQFCMNTINRVIFPTSKSPNH